MALLGRTERRLAFAIGLVAAIPLIVSIYFASSLVDRAFAQAFTPELGEHLDHTLGVYQDLARALKEGMRYQADAIAAREPLRAAALLKHPPSIQQELDAVFPLYSNLVSLGVVSADGEPIVTRDRGRPVDSTTEAKLEVRRQLVADDGPTLVAVFATPRARLDELQRRSEFVGAYHQIERAHVKLKRGDLYAFAAILAVTIAVAVALGTQLARSVTRRIDALARTTKAVAAGNLAVRVPVLGNDELTDLSRGFNQMLSEMEVNRARVEFLQRMSTWQEMDDVWRTRSRIRSRPFCSPSRSAIASTRGPIRASASCSTPRWRWWRKRWARCAVWWASSALLRACPGPSSRSAIWASS